MTLVDTIIEVRMMALLKNIEELSHKMVDEHDKKSASVAVKDLISNVGFSKESINTFGAIKIEITMLRIISGEAQ